MRIFSGVRLAILAAAAFPSAFAHAAPADRPSLRDSFRLGGGEGALCQVQSNAVDPAMRGMFDRAFTILCRDAAGAVGRVYALRKDAGDPVARVAEIRAERAICSAGASAAVDGLGALPTTECKLKMADVDYRAYVADRGKTVYIAEGLAGYDSAVQLALRTIVADRYIPGNVEVATTAVADPVAFARVQAGALDPDQALAEGYRRNNSGSYAEAAEFFDTLLQRAEGGKVPANILGEYIVNRALQKSNLGDFAEADALFEQAALIPTSDKVQLRLRRNFYAMHLINQRKLDDAVAELDRPLVVIGTASSTPEANVIDAESAAEINTGAPLARELGATENVALTPDEKAAILDAQALQLRGTVFRLGGDGTAAREALGKALTDLLAIREGRVTSITRLRAQTMAEISAVAEDEKKYSEAESLLRDGLDLLQTEYPGSIAVAAGKSRLAAYFYRRGRTDESRTIYKEVIASLTASGATTSGFENLLAPYFAMLARQIPGQPALVDDFFLASETLVRPGVADTQSVLARQLSGGSDEASRLFRQSVNLTRELERSRIEYARLGSLAAPTPDDQTRMTQLQESLRQLEADQVATQAKLGQYPQYRAISTQALALADLRGALKPGEAYLKLAVVGNAVYGIFVSQTDATAYLTGTSASGLDTKVDALRDTISVEENGQLLTYPFDVKLARQLYVELIGPIAARLANVEHLVFEPGGGMLRLPLNLLIADQAGVDAYAQRVAKPNGDEFDFTGIEWLGKRTQVSTAVSARSFRDVRGVAGSAAKRQYLGLGQNAPVSNFVQLTSSRSVTSEGGIDCNWPLSNWNRPIAATELKTAESIIGNNVSNVITGPAFTDTNVIGRDDLDQYRILHFATHGLVTAPRPECPARPALLTSFGGAQSDGLLTFKEIYDMRLDADLVILSACDTAGKATVAATREAGITSGGGNALDGLVRAFIGAGGRSVIASHWPAPDDYRATERLISGLFSAPAGTSIVSALQKGQRALMADTATSHPYYWADFVVIGDGAQPVLKVN